MKAKITRMLLLLLCLMVWGCGDGGGSGAVIKTTQTGSSALAVNENGTTAVTGAVVLDAATVAVPAGTTLKAADGSAVTGPTVIAVTYGSSTSTLKPEEVSTLPADTTLEAYVDITITGDKKVKTVSPPIPVTFYVPLPDGDTVDIYSNGGEPGDQWVSEGTVTVAGGKATFLVSHFTKYGAHKKKPKPTGGKGGNNGNGGVTTN